ncbi:MAG TPA: M1 family metallopeptidase [Cytophagaceae bacterium]|nr:M1 family metallopeptidase [Cytophagaceae bacterium]
MKKFFFSLFFLICFTPCFPQQKFTLQDTLRGTLTAERKCFDVQFYDLSLAVQLNQHLLNGSNRIYFKATETFSTLQLDLYENINIRKITDEKENLLSYKRNGNAVFIQLHEPLQKNSSSFLTVYYEGEPHKAINPPWDGGFVWALDSLDRPWVSVACEGVGASLWWPCKDHPSDEPDSMRMRFEVANPLFCASNGNLISTTPTNRNTTVYEWRVHYPINTYNITLNIGAYAHLHDLYTRTDGSALDLDYYVLSFNKEKASKHFEQVKPMLACYEKLFGPYPFQKDGYALIESPYWGMEHQSAIAYGNRFKNNMVNLDYIVVHESGHEWWGNHVSASDHADLWIHEAFTTYGETLLLECEQGKDIAEKYLTGQKRLIKNREPIIGPYGVNYHYWEDSDMYYKGAWMLHTLRGSLNNDSLWFALLRNIQRTFGGQAISSSQLITYINNFTGFDYTGFFAQYLLRTDLPLFEYEVLKQDKKSVKLKFRWISEVEGFSMPLVLQTSQAAPLKIYPNSTFQTVSFPCIDIKTCLDQLSRSFYIETRQIKSKK